MGIMNICNSKHKHSRIKDNTINRNEHIDINIEDNDINSKDISKPITPTTNESDIYERVDMTKRKRSNLKEVLKKNTAMFISNIILVTNATVKNNNVVSLTNAISRNGICNKDNNDILSFNGDIQDKCKKKEENFFKCEEIPISKTHNDFSFSLFITPEENENLKQINSKYYNMKSSNKVKKKRTLDYSKNDNVKKGKRNIKSGMVNKCKCKSKKKKLLNDLNNVTAIKKENGNDKNEYNDESGVILELLDDMCHTSSKTKFNKNEINNNLYKKKTFSKDIGAFRINSSRQIGHHNKKVPKCKVGIIYEKPCGTHIKKSLSNKGLSSENK